MRRVRGISVRQPDELAALLESAELLREEDTRMAGMIRILRVGERILVQEQDPKTRNLIVRELPSEAEAERFVEERLATYDRMWDGCGCKIDYYR